jgi:16S rRNA processing protein RimM
VLTRGASEHSADDLVVAQVLAAHGIRGELKCRIVTDFPKERFKRGNTLLIDGVAYTVQSARIQGQTVLLRLHDVGDRNTALTLRGRDITIRRGDAVALPEGQFYWHEVIGLTVIDAASDAVLGTVTDIVETGANDVYVVRPERGREILVPAIKDVVLAIEPAEGRMIVQPLPGMLPP